MLPMLIIVDKNTIFHSLPGLNGPPRIRLSVDNWGLKVNQEYSSVDNS